MDDPYGAGYTQGYADHQGGYAFQPEEDDDDYEDGYQDGWDKYEEDLED